MTEPNKTKDLEHKLGNLILMTRPLRRQVASSTKPTTEPARRTSQRRQTCFRARHDETCRDLQRLCRRGSCETRLSACPIETMHYQNATNVPRHCAFSFTHTPECVCVCVCTALYGFRAHLSRRLVNMPKMPLETCIGIDQICVPSTSFYYPDSLSHLASSDSRQL